MSTLDSVRIDSFLWAVRIFKTRSLASASCKKNRVLINGVEVKPSRLVKVGDVVVVKKPPISYTYKVLQIAKNRMGAKSVTDYIEDKTPKSEYEQLELKRISGFVGRVKGTGRPTKRDRRKLDDFQEATAGLDFFFDNDLEDDYDAEWLEDDENL
ncbi:S4 domain protein [Bacteroidales bacterium KA00251]|nr:S4 domain protein [Bacteroidales bacterium KA00251]